MRYGKFVSGVYILNVLVQSVFSLACPMGLGFLAAWLLVQKAGAPRFLYPVLIILGTLIGLFSMVRFIIDTMTTVERLEKENKEREKEREKERRSGGKNGKRDEK